MWRKLLFPISLAMVLVLVNSATAAVLVHYRFDGVLGEPFPESIQDDTGSVTFQKVEVVGALTYGEPNPIYNSSGTSANFVHKTCLWRPAVVGADILDLDGPAYTVEMFIKVNDWANDRRQQVILRKYTSDYVMEVREEAEEYGEGTLRWGQSGEASSNRIQTDPCSIVLDQWYHIAFVFNSTDVVEPQKIYIDGVKAAAGGTTELNPGSDQPVGIGALTRPDESRRDWLAGNIDEFRISDVALDPSEFLLYETFDPGFAKLPDPISGAENVCNGAQLCWTPGDYAQEVDGHDIYLGTDHEDVNDAITLSSVYMGSQNRDANCYTTSGLAAGTVYYWRIDEVNDANLWKGPVWNFTTNDGNAYDPDPADGKSLVPVDANLSWMPGCLADSHNVYFGTDFEDVDNATTASTGIFRGNQTETTHDPCAGGNLEYLKVYYWRIDEVGSGGSPVWKGTTLTFRSTGDIVDANMPIWYKLDEAEGDTAFDSSGFENHADVDVGDPPDWDPNEGRYGGSLGFDDDTDVEVPVQALGGVSTGITVSLWLKDAYKDDGDNWVFEMIGSGGIVAHAAVVEEESGDVLWRAGNDTNDVLYWDMSNEGLQAQSLEGWHFWAFVKDEVAGTMSIHFDGEVKESNDVVDSTIAKVANQLLRFGAGETSSNDFIGRMDDIKVFDKALTDVEVSALFRGGDLELAWAPDPFNGEADVARDANLTWKPGDYAALHDVYFGSAWDDVNDANTNSSVFVDNREPNEYDPPGYLELGETYYWRIDEVNSLEPNSPWKGNVWRFRVANFLIIDDMETYNKTTNRIYNTWPDGYANGTGSEVGLGEDPVDPVHGGKQSMEYLYDNADSKDWDLQYYSEVSADVLNPNLKIGSRDWTQVGVKILTLFFYGHPDNDANATEQMYVGLEDTRGGVSYAQVNYGFYGEDMNDIREAEWHQWDTGLSDFAGVDANHVGNMYIGFGIRGNPNPGGTPGGSGVVWFDNIRLYLPKCVPWRLKPVADFTDDCVVNLADVGQMADEWLRTDACLPTQEPTVGPVAYWDYEEGDGNTVNDIINDYDGTAEDNYEWVAGRIGSYAMEFNGGWVSVPDGGNTPQLRLEGDRMGVTAWIKVTEHISGFAELVVKGRDNYETFGTEINDEDQGLTFFVRDANVKIYDLDSTRPLPEGEWLHIAGTYDGNTLTSYLNGQVEMTADIGTIELYSDVNDGFGMAGRWDDDGGRFLGSMDEVRVYSYALSAEEVAHFGTGGSGYSPLLSEVDLYNQEPLGSKVINFRDMDVLLDSWLDEKLWPPD